MSNFRVRGSTNFGARARAAQMHGPALRATLDAMSPLMREIYRDAAPSASKGTVPSQLFATSLNKAAPQPLIGGEAIFGAMGKLIAGAKRDVYLCSYEWD